LRSDGERARGRGAIRARFWQQGRRHPAGESGVFVILPRDQAPGINESSRLQNIVRVVSTVQYLLE
jgi:hypothetical protein